MALDDYCEIEDLLKEENAMMKVDPGKEISQLARRECLKVLAALEHQISRDVCTALYESPRFLKELMALFPKWREVTFKFSLEEVLIPAGVVERSEANYSLSRLGREIMKEKREDENKSLIDILYSHQE